MGPEAELSVECREAANSDQNKIVTNEKWFQVASFEFQKQQPAVGGRAYKSGLLLQ